MIKNAERLEFLLHAILNGGAELTKALREHCELETDIAEKSDIVEELESLYEYVKETMSEGNTVEFVIRGNNVKIVGDECLAISPEGYGDHCSKDGEGAPIGLFFDEDDNILQVNVWDDINSEDGQSIDMVRAQESERD